MVWDLHPLATAEDYIQTSISHVGPQLTMIHHMQVGICTTQRQPDLTHQQCRNSAPPATEWQSGYCIITFLFAIAEDACRAAFCFPVSADFNVHCLPTDIA